MNALKRRVKVTAVTVCAVMAAATVTPVAAQTAQPQQPSHQSSVEDKLASITLKCSVYWVRGLWPSSFC